MSRIGEWLALNLFDQVPEGVPPLDPEDDDEAPSHSSANPDLAPLGEAGPASTPVFDP